MKTDETTHDGRIALQPETVIEQDLLAELFGRLEHISQAPPHPDKVGTRTVFYTLDVPDYDELNHDLFSDADLDVDDHGRIDPDAGSRALVIVHDPSTLEGNNEADVGDLPEGVAEPDTDDDMTAPDDVVDLEPVDDADQEEIEEEVEEVEREQVVETIKFVLEGDARYEELQGAAKEAQSLGYDVPGNLATDKLRNRLEEVVENESEEIPA